MSLWDKLTGTDGNGTASKGGPFSKLKRKWSARAQSGDYGEQFHDSSIVERMKEWGSEKERIFEEYGTEIRGGDTIDYCSIFLVTAPEAVRDRYVHGDPRSPWITGMDAVEELYDFINENMLDYSGMPHSFVQYRADIDRLMTNDKIKPTYDIYREMPFDRIWLALDDITISGVSVPAGETFTRSSHPYDGDLSLILGSDMVYVAGKAIATHQFIEMHGEAPTNSSRISSSSLPKDIIVNRHNNLVYVVIDVSGSMSGSPLRNVKEGFKTAIEQLPEHWDFCVRPFSDRTWLITGNKNEVLNKIDRLSDMGNTKLYDGVGFGLEDIASCVYEGQNGPEMPTVHLFIGSDGGENSSEKYDLSTLRSMLGDMMDAGWLEVYPFSIGSGGRGSLKQILGKRSDVKEIPPQEIGERLSEMIGRVHTQHRPNMIDLTKKKSS